MEDDTEDDNLSVSSKQVEEHPVPSTSSGANTGNGHQSSITNSFSRIQSFSGKIKDVKRHFFK